MDRRPPLQPLLPHPPHRPSEAGRRGVPQAPRGPHLLPAPGPFQAPVGDMAGAEHVRRPLRVDRQDPPRPRGRDLRRGHHDGPVRHRPRTRRADRSGHPMGGETAAGPGEAARGGPGRTYNRPGRDVPWRPCRPTPAETRPLPGHGSHLERGRHDDRGHLRPRPSEPLQRRDRPPPALHLPRRRHREPESRQGLPRGHAERHRPGVRLPCSRALPPPPRPQDRRPRPEGDGPRVGEDQGPTWSPRQPGRRHVGPAPGGSGERRRGASQDRRLDGRPEEVRPGRRGPGAHQPRGVRPARRSSARPPACRPVSRSSTWS